MKALSLGENNAVKIYECRNQSNYRSYCVAYKDKYLRKRIVRASLQDAKKEANRVIAYLATNPEFPEKKVYDVDYYRECEALLLGKVTLKQAVEEYLRLTRAPRYKKISTKDLLVEFLASKATFSQSHKNSLRYRLGAFCKAVAKPIQEITPQTIDVFLNEQPWENCTKYNLRVSLISFFQYAQNKGYLPENERTAAEKSNPIVQKSKPVQVWTIAEMEKLLTVATYSELPTLVLGMMCGIRSSEIGRLNWENIDWNAGSIYLTRDITKTNNDRSIPMFESVKEFLTPYRELSGNILKSLDVKPIGINLKELATRAGLLKWVPNGNRHSFATYALAYFQDAAKVALYCGHSPKMLLNTYKTVVVDNQVISHDLGTKWFHLKKNK